MSRIIFTEVGAPSTPASGTLSVYAKTDKELYKKDSSGVETKITTPALTTATGLTAGTTQTQGSGFALTKQINQVSTVANANDTVVLPTATAGDTCIVINDGANPMRIYPATSDNLGAGVNALLTIALGAGEIATFYAYDTTNWICTVGIRQT